MNLSRNPAENGERNEGAPPSDRRSHGRPAHGGPSADEVSHGAVRGRLSKRLLDVAIAIPALVAAAPIMLVAIVLLQLADPGPVFFRQVRIGQGGRPFVMLKLRTMYVGSDDSAFREFNIRELRGEAVPSDDGIYKLKNDPRVLPVGRFLRRYSVDELPQLINVLRGEMSLVGPRPSLPWEVELYTPEQRRRHECLPGVTGLWQVSGRNRLSVQQMLELDLIYVEQRSLLLDLKILWRTLPAVLRSDTL
ncbi:sugar transferase [Inquilinus limosus]|uniref:sugar transferase n=1 Tax=Inquilinus limosus TaxID=171674 RepID=UPI003F15AD1E